MKLFLTRHGQTEDNLNGIIMGQGDSPLTDTGVEQTHEKARELAVYASEIRAVYSSDLGRCVSTATIISDDLSLVKPSVDKRLREIDYGEYEGRPHGAAPDIDSDSVHPKLNGGESGADMIIRVTDMVNDMYSRHPNDAVIVVTHAGPIAVILSSLLGVEFFVKPGGKIDNRKVIPLEVNSSLSYMFGL